jgi:hypothetical protein
MGLLGASRHQHHRHRYQHHTHDALRMSTSKTGIFSAEALRPGRWKSITP